MKRKAKDTCMHATLITRSQPTETKSWLEWENGLHGGGCLFSFPRLSFQLATLGVCDFLHDLSDRRPGASTTRSVGVFRA